MYKQHTVSTRSLTSMRHYLRIPITVAGGASCNSMFPLFSLIRGTNGVHGDPLALHYTDMTLLQLNPDILMWGEL